MYLQVQCFGNLLKDEVVHGCADNARLLVVLMKSNCGCPKINKYIFKVDFEVLKNVIEQGNDRLVRIWKLCTNGNVTTLYQQGRLPAHPHVCDI
jgi:hypothetical protein